MLETKDVLRARATKVIAEAAKEMHPQVARRVPDPDIEAKLLAKYRDLPPPKLSAEVRKKMGMAND
jgi:hypothetical protein